LLEFPSVVDAVRCAVEVQRGMAERNTGIAPDQRLDFRIGINVGDIIIDGDDIFGDGVNVAARLESLADPGGICVSRVVRDQVLDKLSFTFENLGAQQVKNIARPVPAANKCVANEWRSVWTLACLRMSAASIASRNARWTVESEACHRASLPSGPHGRCREVGNTNCQARDRDADGYLRHRASGSGARPAPRDRSRLCSATTRTRCCCSGEANCSGSIVVRSDLSSPEDRGMALAVKVDELLDPVPIALLGAAAQVPPAADFRDAF